ncbi:MAG: hypothetical protein ACRCY8_06655 [Dermatophilaceae bacterium]
MVFHPGQAGAAPDGERASALVSASSAGHRSERSRISTTGSGAPPEGHALSVDPTNAASRFDIELMF